MFYTKYNFVAIQKFLAGFLLIALFFSNFAFATVIALDSNSESEEPTVKEANYSVIISKKSTPIIFRETTYKTTYDKKEYNQLLKEINQNISILNSAASCDGYTDSAEKLMLEETNRLKVLKTRINKNVDKISTWEKDFYYATKTFCYLIEHGYSKTIASAIIGNMMIETSGGSLALNPVIYDDTGDYYGLCQWSLYYRPEVADMPFEAQLEYLLKDIESEFNTFGHCYKTNFSYEDFIKMKDPEEAALAFAKVYERCASFSYDERQSAASKAYEYFTLEV